MTGDLNHLNQTESDIGDLQSEAETIKELNILDEISRYDNYTLVTFLKENPEVCLSELNRVLNLFNLSEWWFSINPTKAEDGTLLARISIAPPDDYEIKILENPETKTKKIILNKKGILP